MPHVMISGDAGNCPFTVRVPYKNGEPLWDEITNEDGFRMHPRVADLMTDSPYGFRAIYDAIAKQEGKDPSCPTS